MPKALVVSQRGKLLEGLLKAVGGTDLVVESRPDLPSALDELQRGPAGLVVLDHATLPSADLSLARTLPNLRIRHARLAIVPADAPRLLRQVLATQPHALLLDPFDLGECEAVVRRLMQSVSDEAKGAGSVEALAVFLKGLAHEINNPLQGVSGILQILTRDPATNSELLSRYQAMAQGVERIQRTLRELEYFVRARKPQRRLLDPARLVREVSERMRHGDAPLRTSSDVPAIAPAILADQEQLALAFKHLARFAAGPDHAGEVTFSLKPLERTVQVEVVGSTAVVLPTDPEKLLIPYQDLDGSGRSGNLELSAAHGIVRSHKGSLEVEAGPHGSVRFRATLPLPSASGAEENGSADRA